MKDILTETDFAELIENKDYDSYYYSNILDDFGYIHIKVWLNKGIYSVYVNDSLIKTCRKKNVNKALTIELKRMRKELMKIFKELEV